MRTVKSGGARQCAAAFALILAPFAAGCSGVTHGAGGSAAGAGGGFESGAGGSDSGAEDSAGQAGAGARAGAGGAGRGGASTGGASTGGVSTGGVSTGGVSTGVAGGASCVVGAACNCGSLTGTTLCGKAGPSCSCPPADQCQVKSDPACFTACGGEPFGAWLLEGSCYAGASTTSGACTSFTQATPGSSDLRMRILDGGALELFGTEAWSMQSRISLGCGSLRSVEACPSAFYSPNATLFSYQGPTSCTANACGVCDCANASHGDIASFYQYSQWTRDGNNLMLAGVVVPYCVEANELWIGGLAEDGTPKVAYKFKKQSCTGAPVACASRTAAQCTAGPNCQLGACKATVAGREARCAQMLDATGCGVLQGCAWDPQSCAGDASPTCDFQSCGTEPGCTFGAPVEKCVGDSTCFGRDVSDCTDLGCKVSNCHPYGVDGLDCQVLGSFALCNATPGCTSHPNGPSICTGQALCSAQTSDATCQALGCNDNPACVGQALACDQIPLTDCDRMPGCRREW